MAWKEFVVLMFLGSQFVKAGKYCEFENRENRGYFLQQYYYKECEYGCCQVVCCAKDDPEPRIGVIVTFCVVGAMLFFVGVSVIVCCFKCSVCLCYKRGYTGRTIAPAPVHIPLENVQPNNRLPPLERTPQVGPLYGGNTFNNYYQQGRTFVRPGLPPIGNAMGYQPPTQPPGYFEEFQQPPSCDHGQVWTPSAPEHDTVGDTPRNFPPISRQGLQQTSSTIQTNQDRSRGSTEQTNEHILLRSIEQTNQNISPQLSIEQSSQNIPPRPTEQTFRDDSQTHVPSQIPSIDEVLQDQSRPPARTNQNISPQLSIEQSNQNIPQRPTEQTFRDDSPAQVPSLIPSIDEILQDQSRPSARLPPLTVQQQP